MTDSVSLVVAISLISAVVVALIVYAVLRAHERQVASGSEELVGKTAVVKEALEPSGVVFLMGERWWAESLSDPVPKGEEVTITKVEGLKLYVTKKH